MATSTGQGAHSYTVKDMRPERRARARTRFGREPGRRSSVAGLAGRPWLERLERALAQDLFVLHFQPIVALTQGGSCHCEALLRLADGDPGELVAPARFLPAAERYGLILQIDRMVLAKVAELIGAGLVGPQARVAVNLSALSVSDGSMLAHIERQLLANAVEPERLIIEVTETAAICNMRRASAFCHGVQELGCAVALDDFGAGFGSFQYLKRLTFAYLKIDGDFIRSLPDSPNDRLVVEALVSVAKGMGKRTIAEFVGDERTLLLLGELGVDFAQGFYLGRPRPLDELGISPAPAHAGGG